MISGACRFSRSAEDQRIAAAVVELQGMIRQHYPEAVFDVVRGQDPDGCYVWTSVDTDDPAAVLDVVVHPLLTLQIEERVPVYVIPIRTPERLRAALEGFATA